MASSFFLFVYLGTDSSYIWMVGTPNLWCDIFVNRHIEPLMSTSEISECEFFVNQTSDISSKVWWADFEVEQLNNNSLLTSNICFFLLRVIWALVGSMVRSAASDQEDRSSNPNDETRGKVGSYLISPIIIISMTVVANASEFKRKQL